MYPSQQRSYLNDSTRPRPITEVKHLREEVVVRFERTCEVSLPLFTFLSIVPKFCPGNQRSPSPASNSPLIESLRKRQQVISLQASSAAGVQCLSIPILRSFVVLSLLPPKLEKSSAVTTYKFGWLYIYSDFPYSHNTKCCYMPR